MMMLELAERTLVELSYQIGIPNVEVSLVVDPNAVTLRAIWLDAEGLQRRVEQAMDRGMFLYYSRGEGDFSFQQKMHEQCWKFIQLVRARSSFRAVEEEPSHRIGAGGGYAEELPYSY